MLFLYFNAITKHLISHNIYSDNNDYVTFLQIMYAVFKWKKNIYSIYSLYYIIESAKP